MSRRGGGVVGELHRRGAYWKHEGSCAHAHCAADVQEGGGAACADERIGTTCCCGVTAAVQFRVPSSPQYPTVHMPPCAHKELPCCCAGLCDILDHARHQHSNLYAGRLPGGFRCVAACTSSVHTLVLMCLHAQCRTVCAQSLFRALTVTHAKWFMVLCRTRLLSLPHQSPPPTRPPSPAGMSWWQGILTVGAWPWFLVLVWLWLHCTHWWQMCDSRRKHSRCAAPAAFQMCEGRQVVPVLEAVVAELLPEERYA